jgi:hypothetical protein
MATVEEVDRILSEQEVKDCTEEERPVLEACLASITPEQRAKLPILDALLIVRGYWTYVPRQEETNKAFKVCPLLRPCLSA